MPSNVSAFGGESVQKNSSGRPVDQTAVKAVVLPTGEKVEAIALCVLKDANVQAINMDGTPNPSFADKVAAKLNTLTETGNIYVPYRFGYSTVYVAIKHTSASDGKQNSLWFLRSGESGLTGIEFKPGRDRELPILYSLSLSDEIMPREDLVLYPGFVKPSSSEVAIYFRQYEPQEQTRLDLREGATGRSGNVDLEIVGINDLKRREGETWCQVQIKSSKPKQNVELAIVPELLKRATNEPGQSGMGIMGGPMSPRSDPNSSRMQPAIVDGNIQVMYAGSTGSLHRYNFNVVRSQIKSIQVQAFVKETIKIDGIPVPKG